MRILVYPHELSLGGSQINAIDLAAAAAADGHDVLVYGVEGPLVTYIEELGLRFVPARRLRYRPAPSRIAQLWSLARSENIDLIHAYEWPPCLDAYFGAHLVVGVPLVCTVLSMAVSPLVPDSVPLIMGTESLGEEARQNREGVWVLEPPIATDSDHPGIDGEPFRRANNVGAAELLVVTVSRLSIELKLDALVDAIDAVALLADRFPVRLIVVGDGPARSHLEARAAAVNEGAGRRVVTLVGSLDDPRSAYASADVVVGMGSSALRAASIQKPVVVQGERGFNMPLEPDTLDTFLWQGFWGIGDGGSGAEALADHLEPLLVDAAVRAELGKFGRELVEGRFSVQRAFEHTMRIYSDVVGAGPARGRRVLEPALIAGRALRQEIENHRPSIKGERAAADAARLVATQAVVESD